MDRIEQRICEIIDSKAEELKAFGKDIWCNAELGYKEFRTAKKFEEQARALGLETETGLAVTGVKSYLKGKGAAGRTIALMGEMDALPIADHKDANPETGASHCCGHSIQLTAVLGAMMALTDPEVKESLDGNIAFMAVPAEEFIEIEYRKSLMDEGKISYGGGKCELIKVGAVDDIDITVGHHTFPGVEVGLYNCSSNGFVNKVITYHGVASHAADAPYRGVDALNAANLAFHAIDMQRESFQEKDFVRCHGFISRGGKAPNVIADEVTVEYCVRAKHIPAYVDANKKVDRSFRAGAVATGSGVTIETMAGYLPTIPNKKPGVLAETLEQMADEKGYQITWRNATDHITGSTDFGDISCIMPLLQFSTGGVEGQLHNKSLNIIDEDLAYLTTAKIFALTAYKLLKDGGAAAEDMLDGFVPEMTKEQYVAFMESMNNTEELPIEQLPIV
ncbi:MAG: amidohydrolase [Lachnospiraceae bacterium]|nr:amidohydrolase [Lachnospiraceae bacterium]